MFLDKDIWKSESAAQWAGRNLQCFEETESTNVTASRMGMEGAEHGTLVVADKQTGGRGRRGRTWESPGGKNLYFSLLLRPQIELEKASMLTLLMAVSVARAIENMCEESAGIKWPNDILVHGKKVCGILTELHVEKGRIGHVVVGVGINVKNQDFQGELVDKASSLERECGQEFDRTRLLRGIMNCFEKDFEVFVERGDLEPFTEFYHAHLLNKDVQVQVLDPQEPFEGIARGISPTGELLVEREDGEIVQVYAGEVSVRGLQGYV